AYTGVLGGPDADFLLADEHKATEQLILDSGLPYTFLRNGWYTENYTAQLGTVLEHGAVVTNAGDGRVASATRADFAAGAAAVLLGDLDAHLGRAYELSGDVAWGFDEYAAEVAAASGKPVSYNGVTAAEHHRILIGAGLPEGLATILVDVDAAIARGRLAGTSGDLARLIGRPTTPLAATVAAALA
ncbi:MAG TPA: KR domain-containing protein, partial [Streptomyces sp.]|nr:KR domain-containing protein [Streptomyces sp.]